MRITRQVETDALDEFLQEAGNRPWSWRDVNCALWVADWIVGATGRDPAHAFRHRANTADEWKALLDREGGFAPIIGEAMDTAGFARTGSPRRGDVMMVSAPIALCGRMPVVGAIAGICVAPSRGEEQWPLGVARSLRGLVYQRFALIAAWSVKSWRVDCKTRS